MTSVSNQQFKAYREPLWTTVLRNGLIAAIAGLIISQRMGGLPQWPRLFVLALWPSFGGHWIEIFFLNFLRARLPAQRTVQIFFRMLVWFFGGVVLLFAVKLTALAIGPKRGIPWSAWWIGGVGFIAIELIAHLGLQLRGKDNFYNGRG